VRPGEEAEEQGKDHYRITNHDLELKDAPSDDFIRAEGKNEVLVHGHA